MSRPRLHGLHGLDGNDGRNAFHPFDALARREVPLADFVPYSSHVTSHVLRTRDGDYVQVWQLDGIAFEAKDAWEIAQERDALNQFIKSLPGGECALWMHRLRRFVSDRLGGDYPDAFSATLAQRYYASFEGYAMMANVPYLTLVYRPASRRGALDLRLASPEVLRQDEALALRRMAEFAHQVQAGLKRYGPQALGCVDLDGLPVDLQTRAAAVVFSEPLSLFGYLLNGTWERVPVMPGPIREYLPTSKLFFSGEQVELRGASSTTYAALLDLQLYPDHSEPGMLNPILYGNYEYIETQSFSPLTRTDARRALALQRKQLIASGDVGYSQIEAMASAMDALENGSFSLGEYHYSLAVLGRTPGDVERHLALARTTLNEAGFQTVLIDLVGDAAWMAQLPGNWQWRQRKAVLTSRNVCGLSSFHNFATGKRAGNPWGEAVTILKTPSGQPLYFNFHVTPEGEDAKGRMAPASTFICGATGEGKTALELFLVAMARKYGVTVVLFDRDRGMEIAVRAMGGVYRRFETGVPTGMNPLQLEPTEANILYWESFVRLLLRSTGPITPGEDEQISAAVRTVAHMQDKRLRRLSVVRQNLQAVGDNSLNLRLARWCADGRLAWVFDNPSDEIQFDGTGSMWGFDDSELMKDPEVAPAVTSYLLNATDRLIDGRRFCYVVAEAWERLGDPVFRDFATSKLKTGRKQNAFGIFDTQSPSDMLGAANAKTMVEQSATLIFMANPKADHDDYVRGYKLTQREFDIVRGFESGSRCFLIKQGHRSMIGHLDLNGFGDVLDILSATEDNVRLLDEIRAEVGDDPGVWRPLLAERLARRLTHRDAHPHAHARPAATLHGAPAEGSQT